jgi:hypothetical protein
MAGYGDHDEDTIRSVVRYLDKRLALVAAERAA